MGEIDMTHQALSLLALTSLALFSANSTRAHIIIEDMQGRAGYNEMLTLIVPHGCGAEATTAIRLKVPEEITLIVPHAGDGWDVEIKKRQREDEDHQRDAGRVKIYQDWDTDEEPALGGGEEEEDDTSTG